jgi:hypothetical protein
MAQPEIGKSLEEELHKLFVQARAARHEFITIEHFLLGLKDDKSVNAIFKSLNKDPQRLWEQLAAFVEENAPLLPDDSEDEPQPTLGFQRVLQRAIMHVTAQNNGQKEVTGANVLLSIFGEKDSHALFYLHQLGISRLDVINVMTGNQSAKIAAKKKEIRAVNNEEAFSRNILRQAELVSEPQQKTPEHPRLFISYSHQDKSCLERLLVHLRPLEKREVITCWSDKKIKMGDKWKKEIEENLSSAAIAVLLISADFLASDFIVDNELPPLLMNAEANGIRILPVILKPCGFLRDPVLSSFQSVNDPDAPLLGLSHIEQESIYNKIADEVDAEIKERLSIAST